MSRMQGRLQVRLVCAWRLCTLESRLLPISIAASARFFHLVNLQPPISAITPPKRPFSTKMRFFGASTVVLACASVVQSAAVRPRDLLDDLQKQATEALKQVESEGSLEKRGGCSIFNAHIRRDWYVDCKTTLDTSANVP
jgi:hypothetical protein